jgi:hypothetical protein
MLESSLQGANLLIYGSLIAPNHRTRKRQYLHEPFVLQLEFISAKQPPKVVSQPQIDGSVHFEPLLAMHTPPRASKSYSEIHASTHREDLVTCWTCRQHLLRTRLYVSNSRVPA